MPRQAPIMGPPMSYGYGPPAAYGFLGPPAAAGAGYAGAGYAPNRPVSLRTSASEAVKIVDDPNHFELNVNARHYRPEELEVKLQDNSSLVISGQHSEGGQDQDVFISRQFTRMYKLPQGVDAETVSAQVHHNGVLTVRAKKRSAGSPNTSNVPVTVVRE